MNFSPTYNFAAAPSYVRQEELASLASALRVFLIGEENEEGIRRQRDIRPISEEGAHALRPLQRVLKLWLRYIVHLLIAICAFVFFYVLWKLDYHKSEHEGIR